MIIERSPARVGRTPIGRAFSLLELIIVVVVIGIIGAIAVPRVGGAAERSETASLIASQSRFQSAIDLYVTEHLGRSPAHNATGAIGSPAEFRSRLLGQTDEDGGISATGIYGPYLRDIPQNPVNARRTVRINGPGAGTNAAGWRFDTARLVIQPDHTTGSGGGGPGGGGTSVGGSVEVGGQQDLQAID